MAKLVPTPVLGGFDKTIGGVRLWERTELALVSLSVPMGGDANAVKALKSAYGLDMPEPGMSAANEKHRVIRLAPDQAMLVFNDDAPLAEPAVQAALKGAFYTTNQTDAWTVLTIEGEPVRQALERLCPLDLHNERFVPGQAARTVMEHMSAVIVREGENQFMLMSASSSARSFLHAVETSMDYAL